MKQLKNGSKMLVALVLLAGVSSLIVGCKQLNDNHENQYPSKPKVVGYLKEVVSFSFKRPGWPNNYDVDLIPVSKYNEVGIDGIIPDGDKKNILLELSPHPNKFFFGYISVITGAELSSGKIIPCSIGFKIGVTKLNSGIAPKYQTIWFDNKSDLQGKAFVIHESGDGFYIILEDHN